VAVEKEIVAFAERLPDGQVRCKVCQRECLLAEGQGGFCGARVNQAGKMVPLTYGRVAALHWAEVERKPLFHFHPGRVMLSAGSLGCNFRCPGCQNWELAHAEVDSALRNVDLVPPEALVALAEERRALGISFTYNEPTLWFEYTLDCARLAKEKGLLTNYVTNGAMTREALDQIGPFLDAYRVDIKGFSADTYRKVANFPQFQGILEVAERAKGRWGMHVECVTNVTPTLNDDEEELRRLARWISQALGPDTPWHVTRFVPHLRLAHLPATEPETLEKARDVGLGEGLKFVYIGNVPGHPAENTYCPECGRMVIERAGLVTPRVLLDGDACPGCGARIPGRFEPRTQ